jgi:hypothetical protein
MHVGIRRAQIWRIGRAGRESDALVRVRVDVCEERKNDGKTDMARTGGMHPHLPAS